MTVIVDGRNKTGLQQVLLSNYTTAIVASNMTVTISMLSLNCDQSVDASPALGSANSSTTFQEVVSTISALHIDGDVQTTGNIVASFTSGWPLVGYTISRWVIAE